MIDLRALNFTSERNVVDPIAKQLESKLSPCGVLNLFGLLMRITPTYEACVLMGAALRSHSVGQPSTAFFNYVEEAKFWVSLAGVLEKNAIWRQYIKAYQKNINAHFGISPERGR